MNNRQNQGFPFQQQQRIGTQFNFQSSQTKQMQYDSKVSQTQTVSNNFPTFQPNNNKHQQNLSFQQINQQKQGFSQQNQQPSFIPTNFQPFDKQKKNDSLREDLSKKSNSITQFQSNQQQNQFQFKNNQFNKPINVQNFNHQKQCTQCGQVQQTQFDQGNQNQVIQNRSQKSKSYYEQNTFQKQNQIETEKQQNSDLIDNTLIMQRYGKNNNKQQYTQQIKKSLKSEQDDDIFQQQYNQNTYQKSNENENNKLNSQIEPKFINNEKQQLSKLIEEVNIIHEDDFEDPLQTIISQCFRCKNIIKGAFISLSCHHTYEKECLVEHVKAILFSQNFDYLYCLCNVRISYKTAQQIFGADSEEMKILDDKIFSILRKKLALRYHRQFE